MDPFRVHCGLEKAATAVLAKKTMSVSSGLLRFNACNQSVVAESMFRHSH